MCLISVFIHCFANALSLSSENCKIIKYADDSVGIGLICNINREEYKRMIDYVSHASKTKEIVFHMK